MRLCGLFFVDDADAVTCHDVHGAFVFVKRSDIVVEDGERVHIGIVDQRQGQKRLFVTNEGGL